MENYEDYPVDPLSDQQLEVKVREIANKLQLPAARSPSSKELVAGLSANGIDVVPLEDAEMHGKEGYTTFNPTRIFMRKSAYDDLARGVGRARFTLAHETIHAFLHPGATKPRMARGNAKPFDIQPYRSAERQANTGAGILLMPVEVVRKSGSAKELASLCQTSLRAAEVRFGSASRSGSRTELPEIREFLEAAKGFERLRTNSVKQNETKLGLWRALPTIAGENPYEFRIAMSFRISWREYEKTTHCGWRIKNGNIVPWMSEATG